MQKPYASNFTLYVMMATPGKNKKIREYIEALESRVYDLERELSDREFLGVDDMGVAHYTARKIVEKEDDIPF